MFILHFADAFGPADAEARTAFRAVIQHRGLPGTCKSPLRVTDVVEALETRAEPYRREAERQALVGTFECRPSAAAERWRP